MKENSLRLQHLANIKTVKIRRRQKKRERERERPRGGKRKETKKGKES